MNASIPGKVVARIVAKARKGHFVHLPVNDFNLFINFCRAFKSHERAFWSKVFTVGSFIFINN